MDSDNMRTTYVNRGSGDDIPNSSGEEEIIIRHSYDEEKHRNLYSSHDWGVKAGTPNEVTPPPEVPQSSGWSFASLFWKQALGGSSARITRRADNQMSSDGGQKSVYDSEHPHFKSPKDANGHHSPDLDDLHQSPVHNEACVKEFEVSPSHTPENVVHASTSMNPPSPASANLLSLIDPMDRPVNREAMIKPVNREAMIRPVNREATLPSQPISLSQRLTKGFRSLFPFQCVEEASKGEAVIKGCRETINNLAEFWSGPGSDCFLNRHQCDFLISRVQAADSTLAAIEQFPIFSGSTIHVLQELHLYLLDVNRLVRRSYITSTNYEWLRAAVELGDSKYTFSHLVYDIQWCTSLLQCILLENTKESHVEFNPNLCDCQLRASDELELLAAMKEDEEELKARLRAIMEELDVSKLEGNFASKLLAKLEAHSSNLVLINPSDLDLEGHEIGQGAFGVVRKSNFLDCECVVKTLEHFSPTLIEKELEAIQKLGNHPHIVRHFSYSKTDLEDEVYFVMELLEMDLDRALRPRRNQPFSLLEAVSLMLQIGEGMKYMHGKGVAHRDLKPGNVLVNLEKVEGSSRIRSVKIADFGSAKAADRTETNTMNTGTTKYMAPEVMKAKGDPEKARLNLLKADVYSFAMMCIHILTGKYPFELSNQEIKERLKAGERPILRHELPKCPLRLATLLTRCWSPIPHERPPFPSICRELRYIKGLILKDDEQKLQTHIPNLDPPNLLGSVKLEGPWGCSFGGQEFCDMATSIQKIELGYNEALESSFKVTYKIRGKTILKSYLCDHLGELKRSYKSATIEFQPDEFIKQISVYTSTENGAVNSLTIYTNFQSYGPYGEERGTKFTSERGSRVIGFHGEGDINLLLSLGVVTIPDV